MSERVVGRLGLVALAPLLVLGAALAGACIPGTCTMMGCSSSELLEVPLSMPLEELESGRVSGCRNDRCWQGEITAENLDHTNGAVHAIDLERGFEEEGAVRATASIWEENDGSFILRFWWEFDDYRGVKRGDTLSVSVQNAEGAEIARADGRVTRVSDDYPNGEECDETPCRSGHVDVR